MPPSITPLDSAWLLTAMIKIRSRKVESESYVDTCPMDSVSKYGEKSGLTLSSTVRSTLTCTWEYLTPGNTL